MLEVDRPENLDYQLEVVFSASKAPGERADTLANLAETYWDNPLPVLKACRSHEDHSEAATKTRTIGIYYWRYGTGGAEWVTHDLMFLWKSMGYNVVLIADEPPSPDDYPLPENTPRVVIPSFQTLDAHTYGSRAKAWISTIESYGIDILVYCQWICTTLPWDLMSVKSCGIPFVIHTHGTFRMIFDIEKPAQAILPFSYRLADAVVTLSETDRNFWQNFNDATFVTINKHAFDPASFAPAKLEGHRIIWVGRIENDKSPFLVLTIMEEVVKTVVDAELIMVGPISEQDRALFEEEIVRRGLEGHIVLTGNQKHEDLPSWYESASVSLRTAPIEGYPIALAEAKAFGLPVVMYSLPYLTLAEEGTGVISVAQGDYHAAAAEIIRLLEDDAYRQEMGRRSRAHMEKLQGFDFKALWSKIFEQACENGERGQHGDYLMWDMLLDACYANSKRFIEQTGDMSTELQHLQDRFDRCEQSWAAADREVHDLKNSRSFRIGRAITAPGRHIRNGKDTTNEKDSDA